MAITDSTSEGTANSLSIHTRVNFIAMGTSPLLLRHSNELQYITFQGSAPHRLPTGPGNQLRGGGWMAECAIDSRKYAPVWQCQALALGYSGRGLPGQSPASPSCCTPGTPGTCPGAAQPHPSHSNTEDRIHAQKKPASVGTHNVLPDNPTWALWGCWGSAKVAPDTCSPA